MSMSFGSGSTQGVIPSIDIQTLFVECVIEGVNFEGMSYVGSSSGTSARAKTRPFSSSLTDTYWEWVRIWSSEDGCCGPVEFETTFYFKEGGLRLFDVGAIQALFSIQLAPKFKFGTAMEFDLEAVGNQWVYWDFYFDIDF